MEDKDIIIKPETLSSIVEKKILNDWELRYNKIIRTLRPNKRSAVQVYKYLHDRYKLQSVSNKQILHSAASNARQYYNTLDIDYQKIDIKVYKLGITGMGFELYYSQIASYIKWYENISIWNAQVKSNNLNITPHPIYFYMDTIGDYTQIDGHMGLSDEIFLFQGLNQEELDNIYIVNRYIALKQELE